MAMKLNVGIEKYSKEAIQPPSPGAKWLLWCSDGDPETTPKLERLTYDDSDKWYRLSRYLPLSTDDIGDWSDFCSKMNDNGNIDKPSSSAS